MKLTIFTSMTNPKERMDPYEEAIQCYKDFADDVVIVGQDWPEEFSFEYIGKTFQEGFNKSNGDWVIRMDIDNFFHEKDMSKLRKVLHKHSDKPAVVFPKFQIFTPDRYDIKAKMCIAYNKKLYPQIKLNGGGDLCVPTLDGIVLDQSNVPNENVPIWNYDSIFKTKKIISEDRARFARAWKSCFGDWGDRGGGTEDEAFEAWFEMIAERYKKHTLKLKINSHPKYIAKSIQNLCENQFGYNAFGLKEITKRKLTDHIKNYKNYLLL